MFIVLQRCEASWTARNPLEGLMGFRPPMADFNPTCIACLGGAVGGRGGGGGAGRGRGRNVSYYHPGSLGAESGQGGGGGGSQWTEAADIGPRGLNLNDESRAKPSPTSRLFAKRTSLSV